MKVTTKLVSEGNVFYNEADGVIDNNILKFNENGIDVCFDLDNNTLVRKSDGFTMKYEFIRNQETVNSIYINDIDKNVDIRIITTIIDVNSEFIDIEYKLIDDNNVIRYIINYGG